MGYIAIGAAIAMAFAALGLSIGQGMSLSKGVEAIGKQPEAASTIRTTLVVCMAIMETIGVLTFVIAIILTGKM